MWDNYPSDFAIARKAWQSILIIDNLKIINEFDED